MNAAGDVNPNKITETAVSTESKEKSNFIQKNETALMFMATLVVLAIIFKN